MDEKSRSRFRTIVQPHFDPQLICAPGRSALCKETNKAKETTDLTVALVWIESVKIYSSKIIYKRVHFASYNVDDCLIQKSYANSTVNEARYSGRFSAY
jgi:hypothetical protein